MNDKESNEIIADEMNLNEASVKTIDLKKTVLANNDADAEVLRGELKKAKTYYMNIMSSPGSGKTTTLVNTIGRLKGMAVSYGSDAIADEREQNLSSPNLKIGVMEADIDSDVDAKTIMRETDATSVQLHTGGMCHLDADMSRQGLREIGSDELDLVFLENVGNLVCPAEFDTGAVSSAVILSVPEGDDKPLKYPLMFQEADVILVNKIDAMPAFDFDKGRFLENVKKCNQNAPVFFISAKTGEGMDEWCEWLEDQVRGFIE